MSQNRSSETKPTTALVKTNNSLDKPKVNPGVLADEKNDALASKIQETMDVPDIG